LEGCLGDFIVMPEDCCYPIPDHLTFDQAVIAEPFSIGMYAVDSIPSGKIKRIAILGVGPIGLSVMTAAKQKSIDSIYVTDKINQRLQVAKNAGAVWVGNPDETDIVQEIAEQEPLLLDAVIECCGEQDAIDQGVQLLKPGGALLIVGIPEVDRISFDINELRRKEITVVNVRRQNERFQAAIDLIADGKVDIDFMITHHYNLNQVNEAFDLVADYQDGVLKAMIHVQ
jgi:L-iditol 2-dehydrogenase